MRVQILTRAKPGFAKSRTTRRLGTKAKPFLMAAPGNFVIVRRTISQTIVPYKDIEERLVLKKSKSKSTSLGFSSTNNVARCGAPNTQDIKKTQKSLERSRSEVCLRRKSSNVRETSLDVFEERREESLVPTEPVARRREIRRVNTARPQSDFFPEFSIQNKETGKVGVKEKAINAQDAGKRLGRCIATLRREMMSLRKQDQELLKQLTSLNEHIQDLKEVARVQGSIYGSTEDQEYFKQPLHSTTPTSPSGSITDYPSSINGKNFARRERETRAETIKKERIARNELSTGKRIKNDIQGLQETSFEYIEAPCDTSTQKIVRPKTTAKRSRSIADVSRKKISSLRLERKSLSCQFLDSGQRDEFLKETKRLFAESQETLASTNARKARPLSQINAEKSKDANDVNTKQKSLSLSQLRPVTKNTEGSTSDSECSTSGCYGGSSTGSDVEIERSLYFNTRVDSESSEKLDKLFELNSLNLKTVGKRHLAISTQGQFRKKIASV